MRPLLPSPFAGDPPATQIWGPANSLRQLDNGSLSLTLVLWNLVADIRPKIGTRQNLGSTRRAGCVGEAFMDAEERARLIARYREGYRVVKEALSGITPEELDRSATGEWTPRQIAHHLADSEMMSAIRIRRLLSEDAPVIHGYDEVAFARKLTSDRPIEPSLEAMRWARETCAQILARMTEEDWHRVGTHSESGRYSTEDWLSIYAAHAHDHAGQIKRSRGES